MVVFEKKVASVTEFLNIESDKGLFFVCKKSALHVSSGEIHHYLLSLSSIKITLFFKSVLHTERIRFVRCDSH